jgi:hypothetical protein
MLSAKSINISFSCKNQAKYSSTAFLNLDLKTSYVIFDQSKGKANFYRNNEVLPWYKRHSCLIDNIS